MTSADLQRIAFVTRRFGALQGLHSVSYGVALLVGVVAYDFLPDDSRDPMLYVILFAQLLSGAARVPVEAFYRRCFGRVAIGQRGFGPRPLAYPGQTLHTIAAIALALDMLKAAFLPPAVRGISLAGIGLMAGSLWIVVRDWPHRAHYLIPLFAGGAAAVVIAAAPVRVHETRLIDPSVGPYYVLACAVIGLSLVAAGLLDHWLLLRAMWRPDGNRQVAPSYFADVRAALAGTVLGTVTTCVAVWGWPLPVVPVAFVLWMMVPFLAIVIGWKDMFWGFQAYSELTRAREAALLERVKRSLVEPGAAPAEATDDEAVTSNGLVPDFTGHVALPLAMATGALLDSGVRGSGLPSFLAMALAASHLRIAIRDWPTRKYYLLGAIAAAAAAVQHAFIGTVSPLDWAVSFLMLMSGAMLVEGLLDRRLESHQPTFSDNRHANTV